MKVLIKQILREETRGELNNRARHLLDMMAVASLKNIADGDIESMRKALRDVEESDINWNKDVVKSVREKYKDLMLRAKEVLKEEQKKKLFIPRKIDERNADYDRIIKNIIDKLLVENNIKSIKYKINDFIYEGYLDYGDIENSVIYGNGEIILNNGEKLNMVRGWYGISHSDFIDYANAFSGYLTHLIDIIKNNESIITRLVVNVDTTKDKTKIDITFNDSHVLDYFKRDGYNPKIVEFSKIL